MDFSPEQYSKHEEYRSTGQFQSFKLNSITEVPEDLPEGLDELEKMDPNSSFNSLDGNGAYCSNASELSLNSPSKFYENEDDADMDSGTLRGHEALGFMDFPQYGSESGYSCDQPLYSSQNSNSNQLEEGTWSNGFDLESTVQYELPSSVGEVGQEGTYQYDSADNTYQPQFQSDMECFSGMSVPESDAMYPRCEAQPSYYANSIVVNDLDVYEDLSCVDPSICEIDRLSSSIGVEFANNEAEGKSRMGSMKREFTDIVMPPPTIEQPVSFPPIPSGQMSGETKFSSDEEDAKSAKHPMPGTSYPEGNYGLGVFEKEETEIRPIPDTPGYHLRLNCLSSNEETQYSGISKVQSTNKPDDSVCSLEQYTKYDHPYRNQSISKMPLNHMFAMMGLSNDHAKAKWREQRIIDIVRSEGFRVGHQTWIRDTDEGERIRIINSIIFQCGKEFGYDKALVEIIVRRGTYARMQSRLRQERRIKRRIIASQKPMYQMCFI